MQNVVVSNCGGNRLKGILAESSADLPLVSVVTSIFNGQPHVAGCLESVLCQDYPNI
jgi:cellulose synthase/poly-beta-1,6-N-acetylglucosamine synthase-like glycosyltransferase